MQYNTIKPVLNGHFQKFQNLVFNANYRLMQVKSIAKCSKGRILQYFRPSLSYYLSLRPLFYLFRSGRLRWFHYYEGSALVLHVQENAYARLSIGFMNMPSAPYCYELMRCMFYKLPNCNFV